MSIGPDLLLDTDTHDLVVRDGDLVVESSVAQAIKMRILFFRGEWFLNTSVGIPYYEEVFIKQPNLDHLSGLFRRVIIQTPGVTELLSFSLDFDDTTRELSVSFTADSIQGEIDETIGVTI